MLALGTCLPIAKPVHTYGSGLFCNTLQSQLQPCVKTIPLPRAQSLHTSLECKSILMSTRPSATSQHAQLSLPRQIRRSLACSAHRVPPLEQNAGECWGYIVGAVFTVLLTLSGVGDANANPTLTAEESLTINIFKDSKDAVVNVTNLAMKRDTYTTNVLEVPQGVGSGIVWDANGHVVTNYHVITGANDVKVTLLGDEELSAKVIGVDPDKDIAVLQVENPTSSTLHPLDLCSTSNDVVVGQKVFAIGNPFGLDHTLTVGVISGTGREISSLSGRPIQDVIQTDAAINPGNSGGPLLDSGGCLIGINTAIYSTSGASSGVGFAIPVDVVRNSVEQIIKDGRVVRPILGIAFSQDSSVEQLGVKGILVLSVKEDGPAFKAGLQGTSRDEYGRLVLGDIITAINGKKIRTASDLYRVLEKQQVGDVVELEVLRASTTEHLNITLEPSE